MHFRDEKWIANSSRGALVERTACYAHVDM
jgi:hypothetical protein